MTQQERPAQEPKTSDAAAEQARSPLEELEQAASSGVTAALEWVRTHQVAAMLGAFAFGVFLGVLWRR
jgi:hypothetical protein